MGSLPAAAAVDDASDTAYIANLNGDNVSMIDTTNCNSTVHSGCSAFPTVNVTSPDAVAVDGSTDTAYVASYYDSVSMLNTTNCNATVQSGCSTPPTVTVDGVDAMAVDNAFDTVYMASYDGPVSMINTTTCNSTVHSGCSAPTTVNVGGEPAAVAVDDALDTVYVADPDGTVSMINTTTCNSTVHSGCSAVATFNVGGEPDAVAVDDSTNSAYVADSTSDTVSMINMTTCNSTVQSGCAAFPTVDVGNDPQAVAVDAATGTVYVTNGDNDTPSTADNTVSIINTETCNAMIQSGCYAGPSDNSPYVNVGNDPVAVAIDPATDTAYVANQNDNTVSVVAGVQIPTISVAPSESLGPNDSVETYDATVSGGGLAPTPTGTAEICGESPPSPGFSCGDTSAHGFESCTADLNAGASGCPLVESEAGSPYEIATAYTPPEGDTNYDPTPNAIVSTPTTITVNSGTANSIGQTPPTGTDGVTVQGQGGTAEAIPVQ